MAPHKEVFNSSGIIMNIYTAISGIGGIAGSIKNIPKLFSGGLKIASFANGALSVARDVNIAAVAGAVSKAGVYGLAAEIAINNIVGNSDTVEIKDGKQNTSGSGSNGGSKTKFDNLDLDSATTKQKGNYGEYIADDNLINNQSLKDAGYDLKSVGREAPKGPNDKIVKGIDGLYENMNSDSNIKYVIDEAKFGSSKLGNTKDNLQMSDDWIKGKNTGNSRILKAVDNDEELADSIVEALDRNQVERVLSKVDSTGKVTTYRLDKDGKIIGEWP